MDPNKEEMVDFLKSSVVKHYIEENPVSLEIAIYWFASDFHSGQTSNLYSVLSCSEYKPGVSTNDINDEDDISIMFYNELVEEFE